MNSITINNITVASNVQSVTIKNNTVTIDERTINIAKSSKNTIQIIGHVESLTVDTCEAVTVSGTTGSIRVVSGDIKCGAISGAVSTVSGDICCGAVRGSVSSVSGDISIG